MNEHTWEVKSSTPSRSSIASHKGRVGITGEVLNIIMLGRVSRSSFRK